MKWPAQRLHSQAMKGFGMYEVAARLQSSGADVIHLEVGRPADDTPVHIKEAAKAALDAGIVHYGDLQGTLSLREHSPIAIERNRALLSRQRRYWSLTA